MTADRRNAFVVAALVLSMTVGAALLRVLEPLKVGGWEANTLLTAQRPVRVRELEIVYAPEPEATACAMRYATAGDTTCLITTDGKCDPQRGGPRVRLVVVGSQERELPEAQKKALLGVVYTYLGDDGARRVPVSVKAADELALGDEPPAQLADLRSFLLLKRIIR